MSLCFKGNSCGLCGLWDDTTNNDLLIYNNSNQMYYSLSPNWDNYHLFGDSWCNNEIRCEKT